MKKHVCFLLVLSLSFALVSCGIFTNKPTESSVQQQSSAEETEEKKPFYTVEFDGNEVFPDAIAEEAAEIIDPAIKQAVAVLNTVDTEHIPISSSDAFPRKSAREELKKDESKRLYDIMEKQMSEFGEFRFTPEGDADGYFDTVISAVDALRIDRNELFLYCDVKIGANDYSSVYYMPGDLMNTPCSDIGAIKKEVALCDAVVDRIIEKMPEDLDNYMKCCYFTFVICFGTEYDYSEDHALIDYQAYNAFVKGKAICSGYAQAFDRLCREVGIASRFCKGDTDAGRHAWNMIYTENGPVYHDITWYDSDGLKTSYRQGNRAYFFMTPEDFEYNGYVQDFAR